MHKMAAPKMSTMKVVILFAVIAVLWLQTVECRRGGGGGGRGSRGGGFRGSRGGTRGSSSSRVRMYRGPSYSRGSWKTAAAAGVVFGLASYKTRRIYRSHPNREPAICFNEKNLKNGTYGYFVCPQQNQPDNLARCCGPDDAEYCCKGLSGGAIAGIVVGVIVFVVAIVGIVIFCKYRARKRAKSGHVIAKQEKAEETPLNTSTVYQPSNKTTPVTWNTPNDGSLPYSPSPAGYGYQPGNTAGINPDQYPPQQYGVQQPGSGPIGFEATSKDPIPEGDVHGGLPYPINPNMAYPPQGQPGVPPPPYPAT